MPKLVFSLSEQFSDLRSNEVAYIYTIENQSTSTIEIFGITPRIPEDVNLIEVKDISLVAVRTRHSDLCKELSELLRDQLFISSKEIQTKRAQIQREYINEVLGGLTGILKAYVSMFRGTMMKSMERARRRSNALVFQIQSKSDAQVAFERFIDVDGVDSTVKEVFRTKMEKVEILETEMSKGPQSSSIAAIEPDSFFSITYILKFPRSSINPKKYNISIESSYSEVGNDKRHVGGATLSLVISPRPYVLTCLAMLSSILGLLLKTAISHSASGSQSDFYLSAYNTLLGSQCIVALILSLLFFNVYEFTDIGKKITIGIGWRSALLIGILCGLLGERILMAIRSFIGA